jgi:uncharacterized membrane protein YoaK (UPF0700 family)
VRRLAYLLALIAGMVDVAGYIALAGIFTAHVSGDTVTAGVAAVRGDWIAAGLRAGAIALFVIGYFIGGTAIKLALLRGVFYWFSIGAALEAIFLALFAIVHHWLAGGVLAYSPRNWDLVLLTACLAFAMGTQNALLSNVENAPVRTTFVTGMTVNFAHEILEWAFARVAGRDAAEHGRKAKLYASVWLAFAVGGCTGGYLLQLAGTKVFFLPCIAMTLLAAYAWRRPFAHVQPG